MHLKITLFLYFLIAIMIMIGIEIKTIKPIVMPIIKPMLILKKYLLLKVFD